MQYTIHGKNILYLIAEMSMHLCEEARQKKLLGDKYVPSRKYPGFSSIVQGHPKAVPSPEAKNRNFLNNSQV